MNSENTIFFTSCDEGYADYAMVSLLMIRKQIPEAKLAVLGKSFSEKAKRRMKKHQIKCVELDLGDKFYKTWEYPIECYYIFAGPEQFEKMGYKYGVYIDVDVVVCDGSCLLLEKAPKGFAGVGVNECGIIFGAGKEKLAKTFKIKASRLKRLRLQSGVVYFNNDFAKKCRLLETSAEFFDKCIKIGEPRKGDDSLFALIQASRCEDKDLSLLDEKYNYIPLLASGAAKDIICFHFTETGTKPWARKDGGEWDAYKDGWQKMFKTVSLLRYIKLKCF